MCSQVTSGKSSVTIHIPSIASSDSDLSSNDGSPHVGSRRLSSFTSNSPRRQGSSNQAEIVNYDVTESQSEDTECVLMTEMEIKEWDRRMSEFVDKLKLQKEQYNDWENDLRKRRMVASGKLKNLRHFRNKRFELYNCVENYITGVNAVLESKTDAEKSELN